jgi:predicted RNase H-like HicB family nuclease
MGRSPRSSYFPSPQAHPERLQNEKCIFQNAALMRWEAGLVYDIINERMNAMRQFKIIVEKHPDGYIAYPIGLKGIVVGQGDTYDDALSDVKSAIRFHIESFGDEVLDIDPPLLEAYIAEAAV